MPKTLMQSVASELQKERKRLEDELHRVTAALTAFGKVYLRGNKSVGSDCFGLSPFRRATLKWTSDYGESR